MKRIISLFLCFVCSVSLLVGCGTTEENVEDRVFTLNVNETSFASIVQFVIQEKNLLEKYMPEGVTVEYSSLSSGTEMRDALITGDVSVAAPNIFVFTTAVSNGIDLTYIAREGYQGVYNLYTNDENITSITDLNESSKISVPALTGGPHLTFLCMAKDAGIDPSIFSQSYLILSNGDALASLQSKVEGLNASMISFPTNNKCSEDDGIYLLADGSETVKKWDICAVFCCSTAYAEENPDLIEAFYKAYEEAMESYYTEFDYWVELAVEKWGISEEVARENLETFPFEICNPEMFDELMSFVADAGVFEGEVPTWDEINKFEISE
ncbi:MAG: ABC transporter substrate-binding protein [Lachnospiraceae bacterium]|nr:ABC transporter substrate-binding protein [Lachnospiraceae bacterium]